MLVGSGPPSSSHLLTLLVSPPTVYEGLFFVYQLLYLYDHVRFYTPFLHLQRLEVKRLSMEDMVSSWLPHIYLSLAFIYPKYIDITTAEQDRTTIGPDESVSRTGYNQILGETDARRLALPVGLRALHSSSICLPLPLFGMVVHRKSVTSTFSSHTSTSLSP